MIFTNLSPARSDNETRALYKFCQALYNAHMPGLNPPFPGGLKTLSPTRGNTAEELARKINAILFATASSLPPLPSPHIPFSHLDPHSGDTLTISLSKINALTYLANGGTP